MDRQAAEEAIMEKYDLGDGKGCQCDRCRVEAAEIVDTVIEAWEGR